MSRPEQEPYKKCGCKRTYTKEEWEAIPLVGNCFSEDETGRYRLDMRDCPCGNTMAMEFKVDKE